MKDLVKPIVLKRRPEDNQGKPEILGRELHCITHTIHPRMGKLVGNIEVFAKVWRSRLYLRLSFEEAEAPMPVVKTEN
jgi:hypothetical protein